MEHNRSIIRAFSPSEIEELGNESDFYCLIDVLRGKGYTVSEAPDFARCLASVRQYKPAVALFEGAFRVSDSELADSENFHQSAHLFYMTTMGDIASNEDVSARELGVPIDEVGFEFDEERGFYLPGSGFDIESGEHMIRTREKAREKTFSLLHGAISDIPHTSKDCPYTKMLSSS